VRYGEGEGEVFLGRDYGHGRDYSNEIAAVIDEEVRRLIESAHDEAWAVLGENRAVLDKLVVELLDKETLNEKELAEIFTDIVKRPERDVWLSSKNRPVSDIPPVDMPVKTSLEDGATPPAATPGA
jgi:cell division protease FtsH